MQRKARVPNPQYRPVPVNWKLMTEKPGGLRDGELEISFRSTDDAGNKTVITVPCLIFDNRCFAKKSGTLKKYGPDGSAVATKKFSVADMYEIKAIRGYVQELGDIIDSVAKNLDAILASVGSGAARAGNFFEGVHLIPPKVMRIPKMVTAQEISLECLQEEGMLDLEKVS